MKVLILSTFEKAGGAAIASQRLLKALRDNGTDVAMLVRTNINTRHKKLQKQSWNTIFEKALDFLCGDVTFRNIWGIDTSRYGEDITLTKEFRDADVVHLHWVNQGFLSLKTIKKIAESGKAVVWTMHDAWNATGVCHLTLTCQNNQGECGYCPYLRHPSANDISHKVWEEKRKLYERRNIYFVACSKWLKREAEKSRLLHDQHIFSIPNPIDTDFFKPLGLKASRKSLGFPEDRKIVVFVAQNINNKNKGMHYLIKAMDHVQRNDVTLVMLGDGQKETMDAMAGIDIMPLGYVGEEDRIRQIYSAADAFVLPSLSENLPNTIMEAMACGTPSVGFHIGGIPEMIDHKENGYVAHYCDSIDLAKGIEYVLDERNAERLSMACREKAIKEYGEKSVAERYRTLYNVLLDFSSSTEE